MVVFHPRDHEVRDFPRRLDSGVARTPTSPAADATPPVKPYPAVRVRTHCSVMPRIEALAVVHGDRACTRT